MVKWKEQLESEDVLIRVTAKRFIGIFKEASGVTTLVADETYEALSVSILGIGVTSPPTRSAQTLVKLNQGDRIYFGIQSSNLIVFNNAEAQFSIHQVH